MKTDLIIIGLLAAIASNTSDSYVQKIMFLLMSILAFLASIITT